MLEIWAKHRKTEFGLRNARKVFRMPVIQYGCCQCEFLQPSNTAHSAESVLGFGSGDGQPACRSELPEHFTGDQLYMILRVAVTVVVMAVAVGGFCCYLLFATSTSVTCPPVDCKLKRLFKEERRPERSKGVILKIQHGRSMIRALEGDI